MKVVKALPSKITKIDLKGYTRNETEGKIKSSPQFNEGERKEQISPLCSSNKLFVTAKLDCRKKRQNLSMFSIILLPFHLLFFVEHSGAYS
jgi:hypothetical protein